MDVTLFVGTVINTYTGLYRMLSRDKCHEEKKQIRDQCVIGSPISAKVVREAFPGKVFLE